MFSRKKTYSHTYNCREYEGHAIVMVRSPSVPSIFFLAHMKLELRTKHLHLERGNLTFLLNGMSLLVNMNPILSDKVIRKWLFVFMFKKNCSCFLTIWKEANTWMVGSSIWTQVYLRSWYFFVEYKKFCIPTHDRSVGMLQRACTCTGTNPHSVSLYFPHDRLSSTDRISFNTEPNVF